MKYLQMLFVPFEGYSQAKWVKWVSATVVPFLILLILPNDKFPPLVEILGAIPKLLEKNGLLINFATSFIFCIKSMFYASTIAFIFMIIARIPLFQSFSIFCRKFRFLPSVGLSFLFTRIAPAGDTASWLMIFGISTYMIDGAVGIALSVNKDDVNYAKSLRLSRWKIFRELIVYSKLTKFFAMAIGCFAISWMLLASVENIVKANGGIGVVMAESQKYFHLEEVYAIQLLILLVGIVTDFLLNWFNNLLFPYITLKQV